MRTVALFAAMAFALSLAACGGGGGSTKKVGDYMPKTGDITGWEVDTTPWSQNPPAGGIAVAYTRAEAEILIDGHITIFVDDVGGWAGMAMAYYKNSDKTTDLQIYEMTTKDQALAVFNHDSIKGLSTWEDLAGIGDAARRRFSSATEAWLLHAVKGKYFIEIDLGKTGNDDPGKQLITGFLTAVLDRLP